jgi:ABC-type glycerol-3-phosphate transport system permease component
MSTTIHVPAHRRQLRKPLSRIWPHILLLVFSCVTLGPFAWTLIQSFQPVIPDASWTTRNYNQVIDYAPFTSSYMNSIIVAASVTASAVVTSLLVGFVLAKYRFRGREHLFIALIAAVMVPFSAILIPVYVTVVRLGFDDSLGGLIVAGMWSPFGIFTVRQFLMGIPSELLDAARIDGASEWRIVTQLMLPLCTSALTVVAVYTFMRTWDDFLLPAILLNGPAHWTLPVLLSSGMGASARIVSAVVVLTMLPTLIITVVTTKYFIRGIALMSAHE